LLSPKKLAATVACAQLHVLTPLPLFQRKLNIPPTTCALLRRKREGRVREKAEQLKT